MAGISLPAPTPAEAAEREKAQRVFDLLAAAQEWFSAQLLSDAAAGAGARLYLDGRGLPDTVRQQFRLGAAPKAGELVPHLLEAGFTVEEAIAAGVVYRGTGGGTIERFRNRVIFPIEDSRGRVVSFGGRAIDPSDKAKYLNGPETTAFSKGQLLYGLLRAVALLSPAQSQLVVVEGYMDVIACQRAAIPAVAPLGTALTDGHVRQLWQKCDEPVLCFDSDDAGKAASIRIVPKILPLLKAGRSFRICYLVGAKDPDELFAAAGGKALSAALATTLPFYELAFTYACGADPIDTPERKQGAIARLREACGLIQDEELRGLYTQAFDDLFRRRYGPSSSSAAAEVLTPDSRGLVLYKPQEREPEIELRPISCALLTGALENPSWLFQHVDELQKSPFGDPALRDISDEILCYYDNLPAHPDWQALPKLEAVLIDSGFTDLIRDCRSKAAPAPFLSERVRPDRRQALWQRGFMAVNRLYWLAGLFDNDDGELQITLGSKSYYEMRFEADSLETALANGYIWDKAG